MRRRDRPAGGGRRGRTRRLSSEYPLLPPMCGIIGYTGSRPCQEILMAGLQALEYRGYDSAGLTLLQDGGSQSTRAVGPLKALRERVNGGAPDAHSGIAHTRWATHGRVTEANCHPHEDQAGQVHVVMNGIVENWTDLKKELVDAGVRVHLRDRHRGGRPPDRLAVRRRHRGGQPPGVRAPEGPLRVRGRPTTTSPTCWSARATSARWWWAWARARTSSPPPSPRSWPTPAGSS